MGNLSLQRSPWKFIYLQTGPPDTCLFFFLCHRRFPLLCSCPAAHRRCRALGSTSSLCKHLRVALCLSHLYSPLSLASPALATRTPPPLGRHRAAAVASPKLSAQPLCSRALEHYDYPTELLVAFFSSFSTPTPRNAVAIAARTPVSSSSPSPHPSAAALPALTSPLAPPHPRAAFRPFFFPARTPERRRAVLPQPPPLPRRGRARTDLPDPIQNSQKVALDSLMLFPLLFPAAGDEPCQNRRSKLCPPL
jgi:hypothetical protein